MSLCSLAVAALRRPVAPPDAIVSQVKGAVDDFFGGVAEGRFPSPDDVRLCPRQVVVTYREAAWNTWMVRK